MEKIEVSASRGKVGGGLMEHYMRLSGGTADIQTRQLLIMKRSLCTITFFNDKCNNISHFPSSALF